MMGDKRESSNKKGHTAGAKPEEGTAAAAIMTASWYYYCDCYQVKDLSGEFEVSHRKLTANSEAFECIQT